MYLFTQVPSGYDVRVVGYECPEVHMLQWFNLAKGPLHHIPSIDKYFKLVSVYGDDAPAAH
jgi:hypothetical protein